MSQAALIKNPSPELKWIFGFLFWAIMGTSVGYVFRSCGKTNLRKNSFLTGARMGAPVLVASIDTLNKDSLLQVEYGKYIDSVLKHTSISDFNNFIEGGVSVKDYPNLKYADAINAFIRSQQQLFLQKKQKK